MNENDYQRAETARRLKLLGSLLEKKSAEYEEIRDRARLVMVPLKIVMEWYRACQQGGLEQITTGLPELSNQQLQIALERRENLGAHIDDEIIPLDAIEEISQRNGWSWRTTMRWIERYRANGLWGLAPGQAEKKRERKKSSNSYRDIGTLSEKDLELVYQRYEIIKPLLELPACTQDIVNQRAQETAVSARTIWNYLSLYRNAGMAGLAPKERADRGGFHGISERIIAMVQGIRLSNRDLPALRVFEMASAKARLLGENEPSIDQVRRIIKAIPPSARLLADGRVNDFRDKYRFTYRMNFENDVVYQVDHTPVDVLVKDLRNTRIRNQSGEVRPWLTMLVDSASRMVLGTIFAYDHPDRFTVAAVIRQALIQDEKKPWGGIPRAIWVDNGKDFVSRHVQTLCREIGTELKILPPHQPQQKGIVERLFGTFNTRLWSTLPGYVGSNVVERNPNVRATLTLSELVTQFEQFLQQYHNETHSETDHTPINFWNEKCFTEPIDIRRLDVLLMSSETRRVLKTGIKYAGRQYWHPNLAVLVGDSVALRIEPSYSAPDTVEVFHNGQWVCTAYADDTAEYKNIPRELISNAQLEQKQMARETIANARSALNEVDSELSQIVGNQPENKKKAPQTRKKQESPKSQRKPDLFDILGGGK